MYIWNYQKRCYQIKFHWNAPGPGTRTQQGWYKNKHRLRSIRKCVQETLQHFTSKHELLHQELPTSCAPRPQWALWCGALVHELQTCEQQYASISFTDVAECHRTIHRLIQTMLSPTHALARWFENTACDSMPVTEYMCPQDVHAASL